MQLMRHGTEQPDPQPHSTCTTQYLQGIQQRAGQRQHTCVQGCSSRCRPWQDQGVPAPPRPASQGQGCRAQPRAGHHPPAAHALQHAQALVRRRKTSHSMQKEAIKSALAESAGVCRALRVAADHRGLQQGRAVRSQAQAQYPVSQCACTALNMMAAREQCAL